jgi:hypothetical protein
MQLKEFERAFVRAKAKESGVRAQEQSTIYHYLCWNNKKKIKG